MSKVELQLLYDTIYPDSKAEITKEDCIRCNINIENENVEELCDYLDRVYNRINISKTESFKISEHFAEVIYGNIEPFCFDKEQQGVMLSLYDKITEAPLYLWVSFTEDNLLMLVTSNKKNKQNICSDIDLQGAQYFREEDISVGIDYALSKIDTFLKKDLSIKI